MYVPYTKNLSSEHFAGLHKNSASPDESVPSHEAHENQNATRTNEDLMDQNVQSFYDKRISKSSEGEDYGHEEKQARAQLQLVEQHQKRDVSAAETVERENASTQNESSRLQKPPANFSMNIRHPQIPRDPPPPPPKNDSNKKEKPKGKSDLILPPPKGQPSNTKLSEVMKERYIHRKEKESVKGKKVNVKIKALKFKFTKPIARKVSPTGNEVFLKQINEGKKATESKHAKNIDNTSVRKVEGEEIIEGPFLCRNAIERNVAVSENIKKSKTETSVRQEKYQLKPYTAPEEPAHRSQMKSSYTVEDDKMFRCTSYDKNMEIIKKNEDKRRRILGRRQVLEKEQPRVKETIPEVGIKQRERVKNEPGKAFEKDFDISEDKPRINIGDSKKEIKNNKVSNRIDIDIVKETIPEVGTKQHEQVNNKPGKVLEKDFDISEDKPRIDIGDSKKEIKNTKVSNRIDIDIVKETIPEVGITQHEQVKNKPGKVLDKDFDISEDKPRINIGDSKKEIKNTKVSNRIDIDVGEKIDKIRPEISGVMNKLPEIDYDKSGRTIKKKPPTIRSKTGKTIEKALLASHLEQKPVSNDNIEGANITVDEETLSRGHTEDSTETIKKNEELRRRIFGKRKVFKEEQEQLEAESEIVNKNKPEYGHPRQLEVGIAEQPPETDHDKSKNVTNKRDHTKKEAQSPTFSKKDKSPTKNRLEENLDEELNTKNLKSSYTVDDDIIFLSSSYQGDNVETIKKNQELRRRIFGRRKVFKEEQEELDEQSELGSKPSENTKDPPVFEKDPDPLTEPHRINIEKLRNEIQDISQKRKKANAEKSERLVQQEISEQAGPSKLPEVDVSKKIPEIKYEETKGTKETKDNSKKETKSPTMKSKESGRKGEPLAEESKTLLASNHDQKNIETIQNNEELRRTIFGKRKVFKGEQDQLEEESELGGKPSGKATYELIKVYEKDLEKRRINIENLKEEIKNINENRKNEESLTKFEKLRQKVISGQPAKLSKVDVNKTVPEMGYEKNRCMKEKIGNIKKETLSTIKVSTPTARTDKSLTEAQVLADLIESIIIKKIKSLDTVDNDKVQLSSSHRETNKKDNELKPTVGSKGKGFKEYQDKVEKELSEKNKVVPTEDFRRELDDSKETRIMNIESLRQEIEDKDINRQTAVAVEKFEKLRQKMIGNNEDHSRLLKDDDNKSVPKDCEQSGNAFEDNMTLAKQETPENKVLADKSKRSEFAKSRSSRDIKMINAENLRNEIAQKQYIREANGKHKEISATYVNNRVSKASSGVKQVVGDGNKKDSLKSGKEKIHLSKTVVKDVKPRSFSAPVKCRTGFRTPDMRIEDQNKHKNESFMEKGVIREARNHLADPSLYQKKEISPKSQRKEVKPRSYSVPIQKASEELTNERQYKYILDDAHVPEKAKKKADKLDTKDKKKNELAGPPLEIGVIRETRNHIGNMLETGLPKPNQKEKVISMDLGVIRESRNNIGDINKTDLSKPQKVKVTSSKTGRQEAKPRSYSAPVQKRSEVRNTDMNSKKQYKYMLDDVPEKASKKADKLDAKDKKKQELSGLSVEIKVLKEAIKDVDDVDKRVQSKLQEKKVTSSNSARTEVKSRSSSAPVQKSTEAKSQDVKSKGQNKFLLDYKPDKGNNIDELDTNEKKSRKSSILLKEDTKPAASVPKLDKNLINVEKTSSKIDQKQKTSPRATSPPHAALKRPHTATAPFRPPSPTKHSTPKSSDNEPKASKTATIQLERTKQPDKLTPADSKYLSDRAKRNRRSSSLQSQPKKDDDWRSQSPMPRARSEVSYYDQYKKRVQSLSPAPRAKKVEGTSSEKDKSQETQAYDNILEEKECDDCFSSKGKPAKDAKSETKEGTKKASGGGKGSAGKPSKKKSNLVLHLILPKIETNKEDAPIKLTSTPSVPTQGGTEKKKADSSVPSKALSSAFVLQEKPSATSVTPTKKMSCRLDDFVCADSFVKAKEEAKEPEKFKDPQAEFKQLLDDPYSKILSSKYLLRPTQQYAKSCRLDEFESGLSDFLAPQPQQGLKNTKTEVLTSETESKKSDTKIQHSNKQDITMMHSEEFKGTIVDQKQQEPKPQAPLKVTATLPKPKQDITMMDTEEFKGIFVDQKQQESKPQALLKATATLPKPKPQEEDSSKEKQAPEKLKPGKPSKKCIITLSRSPYMPITNIEKTKITYRVVRRRTYKSRFSNTKSRVHKPKKEISNSIIAKKTKTGQTSREKMGIDLKKYHEIYLKAIMERYRIDEIRLKEDECCVPKIDIEFLKRKIRKEKLRRARERKVRRFFEGPESGNPAFKSRPEEFSKTYMKDFHNDIKIYRESRLNQAETSKSCGVDLNKTNLKDSYNNFDRHLEVRSDENIAGASNSRKDDNAENVAERNQINIKENCTNFTHNTIRITDETSKAENKSSVVNNVQLVKPESKNDKIQLSQNKAVTTNMIKDPLCSKYLLENQIKTNPVQSYGFQLADPPAMLTSTTWHETEFKKSTSKYLLETQVDSNKKASKVSDILIPHVSKEPSKPKENNLDKRTYTTNVQFSEHILNESTNETADTVKSDLNYFRTLKTLPFESAKNEPKDILKTVQLIQKYVQRNSLKPDHLTTEAAPNQYKYLLESQASHYDNPNQQGSLELQTNDTLEEAAPKQYNYLLEKQASNENPNQQGSLELQTNDTIKEKLEYKYLLQRQPASYDEKTLEENPASYKYLLQNQSSTSQASLEFGVSNTILGEVPSSTKYLLQDKDEYLQQNQASLYKNLNTDQQVPLALKAWSMLGETPLSSEYPCREKLQENQVESFGNSFRKEKVSLDSEARKDILGGDPSSFKLVPENTLKTQSNCHEQSNLKVSLKSVASEFLLGEIPSSSKYTLHENLEYKYLLQNQACFNEPSDMNEKAPHQYKMQYKCLLQNQEGFHEDSGMAEFEASTNILEEIPATSKNLLQEMRQYKHLLKNQANLYENVCDQAAPKKCSYRLSDKVVPVQDTDWKSILDKSHSQNQHPYPGKYKSLLKENSNSNQGSDDRKSTTADTYILEKHFLSPRQDNLETSKYLLSQVDSDEVVACKLVGVRKIDENLGDPTKNTANKDKGCVEKSRQSHSILEIYASSKTKETTHETSMEADYIKTKKIDLKGAENPTFYQIVDLEMLNNTSSHLIRQIPSKNLKRKTIDRYVKKGNQAEEIDIRRRQYLLDNKRTNPSLPRISENKPLNTASLRHEHLVNNQGTIGKNLRNCQSLIDRSKKAVQDKGREIIRLFKNEITDHPKEIKKTVSENLEERFLSTTLSAGDQSTGKSFDKMIKNETLTPKPQFLNDERADRPGLVQLFEKENSASKSKYLLDNQLLLENLQQRTFVTHTSDKDLDKIKKSPVEPKKDKKRKNKKDVKIIPAEALEDDLQKYILDKNMSTMFVDQPSTGEPSVKAKVEKIYEKEEPMKKFNKKLFQRVSSDQSKKRKLDILDLGKVSSEAMNTPFSEVMSKKNEPSKKVSSEFEVAKQKKEKKKETSKSQNIVVEKSLPLFKKQSKNEVTRKELSAFDTKLRVPPKSISKSLMSQSIETTTLGLVPSEKVMCVGKEDFKNSVLDKYKHLKITYVSVNRPSSKKNEDGFSTVPPFKKEDIVSERPLPEVIAQRYELLKKLHDEFNQLNGEKNGNFERVSKRFDNIVKKEKLTVADLGKTDEDLEMKTCKVNLPKKTKECDSFKEEQNKNERETKTNMFDIVKQKVAKAESKLKQPNIKRANKVNLKISDLNRKNKDARTRSHGQPKKDDKNKKTGDYFALKEEHTDNKPRTGRSANMVDISKENVTKLEVKPKQSYLKQKRKTCILHVEKKKVFPGVNKHNLEKQIRAKIEKLDKKEIELEKEICKNNIKVKPDDHSTCITEILIKRITEADVLKEDDQKTNRGQKK
ncbi:unnamed protein product [Callosobruchus maculatus]|uniref:Uncharacterized protein n=2 Tax=Callosobruchus maculatus TaxID=64391 RepID=A0A653DGP8_CALMS|nr:unnamed protein product [Callosobruchus maculatus]